ncbi:MAG: hypothetical protein B6I36_09665 [Desulfobacteraceae bacterium 4572_35.1]|nr:MAG: hypothetical protein B6I36_09665 [Desulfobacteraceae bacterium 4572_35.1]
MKKVINFLFTSLLPSDFKRQAKIISCRNVLIYFFFQRIIGINRNAPWPVHWSSKVISPEKIIKKSYRPFPGYMIGQYIQAVNGIHIGYGVRIGPGAKLISANHNIYDYALHDDAPPIIIGDNCWIGANVIILPGVKLGTHVVVAAGAVVTRSFEEDDIVLAGVPAKVIKKLELYQGELGYDNEGI